MARNRDKTQVPPITAHRRRRAREATQGAKTLRVLEILGPSGGEYWWHCKGENGEIVYSSRGFNSKQGAKEAAAREHEGRSGRYGYVLKWTDERSGEIKRETL